MSVQLFATKAMSFFRYVIYEKETFIPGVYDQEKFKRLFLKGNPSKYSCTENGGKTLLKRRSIIFPSSHYVALSIEPTGIRCEVKMNPVERVILIAVLSMIVVVVLALPVIAGSAIFLPIDKNNLVIVTPIIIIASFALVAWLKCLCFVLAYISGVTKINKNSWAR